MDLKPGSRWKSAVCTAEFVVVRPAAGDTVPTCGGHPIVASADKVPEGLEIDPALSGAVLVGKRYHDPQSGLEVLVTKVGVGLLAIDGRPLVLKEAQPLPSSD